MTDRRVPASQILGPQVPAPEVSGPHVPTPHTPAPHPAGPAASLLLGEAADRLVEAGRATAGIGLRVPPPARRRPEDEAAPSTPARSRPAPPVGAEVALARIERLGGEVPGMLRSIADEVQVAIRLDFADFARVLQLRKARNGFPVEAIDRLGEAMDERRQHAEASLRGALAAWQQGFAPFVQRPRQLRLLANGFVDVAARVRALDEAYAALEQPGEGWVGADADAYRSKVAPQRAGAAEHAEAVELVADRLREAAILHATVYVVAHQTTQACLRELRQANANRSDEGDHGRRMGLAAARLDHLAAWFETYAQSGDWKAQVRQLGDDLARLPSRGGSLAAGWPTAAQVVPGSEAPQPRPSTPRRLGDVDPPV